jgi:hypothetical protein
MHKEAEKNKPTREIGRVTTWKHFAEEQDDVSPVLRLAIAQRREELMEK